MEAKTRLVVLLLVIPVMAFTQVGINTTSPNAQLEIQSSNVATPSNTDGIIIPKIDEYPVTNPTVAQDGMLVFATGNGSVSKGFYYWDNASATWIAFAGANVERIDDLYDAKSDYIGYGSSMFIGENAGQNDDASTNFNVGIGYETMKDNTSGGANTALGFQSLHFNTIGNSNTAIGTWALRDNVSGNQNTAIGLHSQLENISGTANVTLGSHALRDNQSGGGNTVVGYSAGRQATGSNNIFLGANSGYNETNSNRLYIENSSSADPLIYGEFDTNFVRINGDFEVERATNVSATVVSPFGFESSLKLFERGGSGDFGFEFQYDGGPDKLYLWSRTFAGNEGVRMTWLKDGRVGMNDSSPDARLDIEAINQATPNNTDGLLIPRIDAFPSANPGANQNGMLVFLTTDNSFYFWRNSSTSWQKVNIESINDLADGKSDNDGSDNGSSVFLGLNAGANDNETDNDNVGVGFYALHNNISGASNTAVGSTALISNTSGSNNSAFGSRALYWSTTGSGNSAFGSQALEANTTGYSNTAISYEALTSNTTGYHNTAIGYEALESNTIGNFNTALGYEALSSSTDTDSNTAIGYTALRNNTTGFFNTAVGFEALRNNTIGYRNTAFGFEAMRNNTSGLYNSGLGLEALENNTTGDYNTAVGHGALPDNTTGNANTALGNSTSLNNNFSNTVALGYNADPSGSNQVRIGNAGIATIGGFANWSLFSDGRIKTNVQEDIVGLEFIKKLRPVSYNYNMDAIARYEQTPDSLRLRDAERLKGQEVQTGFIAQEVEAAAEAVGFDFHGIVKPIDANDTYALRYAEFVVPLVKAMQEQQDLIETQQEEIDVLRSEIEKIKLILKNN